MIPPARRHPHLPALMNARFASLLCLSLSCLIVGPASAEMVPQNASPEVSFLGLDRQWEEQRVAAVAGSGPDDEPAGVQEMAKKKKKAKKKAKKPAKKVVTHAS